MRTHATVLLLFALSACQPNGSPTNRFYVSLERGNAVVALDAQSGAITARFSPGQRPRGMRLSPDGQTLFVAVSGSAIGGPNVDESKLPPPNRGADGIAVIDLSNGKVSRVLKAGNDPETFILSPDGRTLFVSNEDSGTVSAISVDGTRQPQSTKVGEEPEGIAVTDDGARLFVACEASDHVAMVDARTLRPLGTIPIQGRPRTLLLSRDGRRVFVAVEGSGQIAILSASTGKVDALVDVRAGDQSIRPMGMTELPRGELLVTTGRAGLVLVIDPAQRKIVRRIEKVGARPWGIAVDRTGSRVATANGPSDDVTVLDPSNGAKLKSVRVGAGPWGVISS